MQPPADAPDLSTADPAAAPGANAPGDDVPSDQDRPAAPPPRASSNGPLVPAPREEAAATVAGPAALTDREEQILAFERKWWKHAGSKEQAIRDAFSLSATRYYQLLNGLLDSPAALERDPLLVARLRRLRSTRARTRRR
jgi:hypothetical protein